MRCARGRSPRTAPHDDPPRQRRAAIVVNPTKFDALDEHALRRRQAYVAAVFRSHGWDDPLWLPTTPTETGGPQARRALAEGVDVVLAAGGDGTVRAVAQALAGTSTPMALLPAGTGNLLARNLGVPHADLAAGPGPGVLRGRPARRRGVAGGRPLRARRRPRAAPVPGDGRARLRRGDDGGRRGPAEAAAGLRRLRGLGGAGAVGPAGEGPGPRRRRGAGGGAHAGGHRGQLREADEAAGPDARRRDRRRLPGRGGDLPARGDRVGRGGVGHRDPRPPRSAPGAAPARAPVRGLHRRPAGGRARRRPHRRGGADHADGGAVGAAGALPARCTRPRAESRAGPRARRALRGPAAVRRPGCATGPATPGRR